MKINESTAKRLGTQLIKWLKQEDQHGNDKGNIFYEDFLFIEKLISEEEFNQLMKYNSFMLSISKAKKIQEIKLQKYGVADRLNVPIVKFILEKKHGWEGEIKDSTKSNENNESLNFKPDGQ
jgi:hypothetical protein